MSYPHPGTAICDRYKAEGRLFTEDWRHYDHTTVVYRPAGMTPRKLAGGQLRTRKALYRPGSILRRLPRNRKYPMIYTAINLAMRSAARRARVPLAPEAEAGAGSVPCVPVAGDTVVPAP